MSYYIKVRSAEDAYLSVYANDFRVIVAEGNASNAYKWNLNPLNPNQLVARHDATKRYLEIAEQGAVNAITVANDNTKLFFQVEDDTLIVNRAVAVPVYMKIVAKQAVSTIIGADATHFSIISAEWFLSAKDKY